MKTLFPLVIGASLLGRSRGSSDAPYMTTSTVSTIEQYCFPKSDGPFAADSIWPSITMIYSGITLTTTPVAVTTCAVVPTLAPIAGTNNASMSGNSIAASGFASDGSGQSSVATLLTSRLPPVASGGPLNTQNGPLVGSSKADMPKNTGAMGPSPKPNSGGTTADPESGTNSLSHVPMTSSMTAGSDGAVETDTEPASANSELLSTSTSDTDIPSTIAGAVSKSTADSSASVGTGSSVALPPSSLQTATYDSNGLGSTNGQLNPSASIGLLSPVGPLPGSPGSPGSPTSVPNLANATVSLSPAALDALQFAQFLKNLGVSVFNSSNSYNRWTPKSDLDGSSLSNLVANISTQERTQQRALRELLRRTGNTDVPPCQYLLPSNATETALLMRALKSVEVGVFMFLAESLSPEDTSVAIVLSSMASVAARQNALLHAYAKSNASTASFETPLTDTLAYNLALNYVQPGSCTVEQPIPLLPTLSMNGRTVGYARPSTNATFSWDAAGRAAASRSGKPLFIGWVNQVDLPVYTSLLALGDGAAISAVPLGLSGTAFAVLTAQPGLTSITDLTEAALAGPVVVNLLP